MPTIDMHEEEWQKVLTLISTKATWAEANPLLMKMTQQLAKQAPQGGRNSGEEIHMPESNPPPMEPPRPTKRHQ